MTNFLQPSMGGHFEQNEQCDDQGIRRIQIGTNESEVNQDQMRLEGLLAAGFAWDEATKLLGLRENLYENAEMRQRVNDDARMQFGRWLIEHGELDEA